MDVEFIKVCDTAQKDSDRIKDLEILIKNFYKNQKTFEDQMDARKQELDNIKVKFEALEPVVVKRPELDATLGQVEKAVQKLAEENMAQ